MEGDWGLKGRWYLKDLFDSAGTEFDPRVFTYGKLVNAGPPLMISLYNEEKIAAVQAPLTVLLDRKRRGKPLDLTFTNDDIPVATRKVADILSSLAATDIQRIPVRVESQDEDYEIINVIACVDCIDVERSDIEWYEEGNDVRPDLAGTPELITELVVDPKRTGNHHIFRLVGWEMTVVVSDLVKNALERARASGVRFDPV
jgi:hypothetical protein